MRRVGVLFCVWMLALALGASAASASTTTTINFDPGPAGVPTLTAASPFGPGLGTQYAGVNFAPAGVPASILDDCSGQFYYDPANAHSSPQVGYSFCPEYAQELPYGGNAEIAGQLTEFSNAVSVWVGAPGGDITSQGITYPPGNLSVTLTAYTTTGTVISHDTAAAGGSVSTFLSVTAPSEEIAYFTIAGPSGDGSTPMEIDNLSFEVPTTPPAPVIGLGPLSPLEGFPGQTVTTTVTVSRFNDADQAITLHVGGLPSGVTLNGGSTVTIPATGDTAKLTFSIASSAVAARTQYSITASTTPGSVPTSSGSSTFTVTAWTLGVGLTPTTQPNLTISPLPCSSTRIEVYENGTALDQSKLTLSSAGNTSGLSTSLTDPSGGYPGYLTITSNGSGGSGTATYTLTLADDDAADGNVTPGVATVTVNRVGLGRLTTQGMLVTQGVMYEAGRLLNSGTGTSGDNLSSPTLVAGKTTVVRVYADAETPGGVTGATGLLYGYVNGKPLPGSPLPADYGPLNSAGKPAATLPSAGANSKEQVSDAEMEGNGNAYTFTLPITWTEGGLLGFFPGYPTATTIKLVGEVLPAAGTLQSPSCNISSTDSYTVNNVPFSQVGYNYNAAITAVAMPVNGLYPAPTNKVFVDAEAVTPMPDGWLSNSGEGPVEPYIGQIDVNEPTSQINQSDLMSEVESYNDDTLIPTGEYAHTIGIVPSSAVAGLTNGDGTSVVTYDPSEVGANRPLTSVSHELFHQYGLVHAGLTCGSNSNGQVGEAWPPDNNGQLDGIGLNPTSEPYQFIYNGATINGGTYTFAYDLMSYCVRNQGQIGGPPSFPDPDVWVSPRNWEQLISNFGITNYGPNSAGDTAGAAAVVHRRRVVPSPLATHATLDPSRLSVTGFVSPAGVDLTNVGPQVGLPTPPGSSVDSFTLTARGSHGQLLASVPMIATTGGHVDEPAPTPLTQISAEVPSKGVDSVQLVTAGKVVASRTRPARAPRVRVTAPRPGARVGKGSTVVLRWRATNPEHLALTAMVDYSRDGGRTWRTVFVGPNQDHVTLRSFYLTASRKARIRVRISDGFNESDAVSGVFVSLGAPPEVTILTQLAARMSFEGDSRPALQGEAVDQELQALSGRRLRWFDGPFLIGTGSSIMAGPLPAGVNHVRLVARDPSGRTASAALTVNVSPVVLRFLKLKLPTRVSRHANKLTFRASASTPTTLTIGRHHFKLGLTAHKFSLPIRRGRAELLLNITVVANKLATRFAAIVKR